MRRDPGFEVIFPQIIDWDVVFETIGLVSAVELLAIFGLGDAR